MMGLLFNNVALEKIQELKKFAEENPLSMDDLLDMVNEHLPCAGDTKDYSCFLNFGYKIVFTIEIHPMGEIRHTSISAGNLNDDLFPSVQAVKEIIILLGFENKLEKCKIQLEKRDGKHKIIHVAEIIK